MSTQEAGRCRNGTDSIPAFLVRDFHEAIWHRGTSVLRTCSTFLLTDPSNLGRWNGRTVSCLQIGGMSDTNAGPHQRI